VGWFRLPRAGLPVTEELQWPPGGKAIVEVTPILKRELKNLEGPEGPDLVVAEVAEEAELQAIADAVRHGALAALIFTSPKLRPEALSEAQALAPEMAIIASGHGDPTPAAGRAIEELVRRRVYRILLTYWRIALEQHEHTVRRLVPGTSVTLPPRPTIAPLSTIDNAHVSGVVGLWWPGTSKPSTSLGLSQPTVRRVHAELPKALRDALDQASAASLPEASKPLDLVIVEDNQALAQATSRLLQTSAEKRLGRALNIRVTHSATGFRQLVDETGFPDVCWVDMQLETARSGLELVRWLRSQRASSVILGKTARAPHEDIRELTRLGALSVWTPSRPREIHAFLADALRVSDEGRAIHRLETSLAGLEDTVLSAVAGGIEAASAVERVRSIHHLIEGLEVEMSTLLPEGVGDPAHPIAEIRANAVRMALASSNGNVTEAARMLGISPRRLLALVDRTRAGAKHDEEGE
jgi:CheY-like chemotaxis protein